MWIVWLGSALAGLPELQAEVLARHPSLEARHERVRALQERARVAGTWADPRVTLDVVNLPTDALGLTHPMSGVGVRVAQQVRSPGGSSARRAVGEGAADVASAERARLANALELQVARAWWAFLRSTAIVGLLEERQARLVSLQEAVDARYQVGQVGQSAVLRLQVELLKLEEHLADGRQEAEIWSVELASLVDHPVEAESIPAAVEPPDAMPAVDGNPVFEHLAAQRATLEARLKVARTDKVPDPTVFVGYRARRAVGADAGADFVSAGVTVPVPVASGRRAAGEAGALHGELAAVAARERAERETLTLRLEQHLARWRRAHARADAFSRDVLPAARAVAQATTADFAVGRADFGALIDADVAWLGLEQARIEAVVATHIERAEVVALTGAAP